MIPKQVDAIDKADIDSLVANTVVEGRTLDFKLLLPDGTDDKKKEFLADVSSFANAAGGDLIYGVDEERDAKGQPTGIPSAAPGLAIHNTDAELRRLEGIIRDGIEPRINGIHVKAIEGFAQGPAILIRIPKSWLSPHMVTYKGSSRFYSRTGTGKHPLDVTEIRSAFALSESLPKRLQAFRDDRVAKVVAGETPIPLQPGAKVILHLFPLQALEGTSRLDPTRLKDRAAALRPLSASGWDLRYNIDGFLVFAGAPRTSAHTTYTQVFRTGAIEAVDSRMFNDERAAAKIIPSVYFEREIIQATTRYIKELASVDFTPPIFLMLTLTGVKGFTMAVAQKYDWGQHHPIDRDTLFLPDVIIDDVQTKPEALLKLVFDALWQSMGWDGSLNYDGTGSWREHQ